MEPYPNSQDLSNYYAQAKRLQQLFNEKVIDLFLRESEELMRIGINLRHLSQHFKLQYDMEQQYHSMKRVFAESERLIQISKEPEEGWKTMQMDEKCTMSVRANKTLMELKSRGILDIDIKHALIIAYLIKLYTECFPFCKEAFDIQQPTKLEKIGFIRLSIPIPLIKDRSCLLRGIGFQYKERPHKVCIYAEGITDNKDYLQRHNIDPKNYMKNRQLLDFKHFAVEMTCLGQKKLQYTGYALVDHHIPILPERLILFVAKELGKHIFNKLMKDLQQFDQTVWAKELKENHSENGYFYDWIDGMIKEWVKEIQRAR